MKECIICESKEIVSVLNINNVPIFCNVLLDSKEKAMSAVKGELDMYFCKNCGHLFNNSYDSNLLKYGEDYDNTLHYSKKFQEFAEELSNNLISKYSIEKKNVIDIGCGKGDFLKLICDMGNNNGVGFDASYQLERHKNIPKNIRFIQDFFDKKYSHLPVDLVCCRQVLEHIEKPAEFLKNIMEVVRDKKPIFYFEVPNALYTIKDLGIWDLIYEHISYFTKESITYLFNKCGLKILHISEGFGGQYLMIEAEIAVENSENTDISQDISGLTKLINVFSEEYYAKKKYWENFVKNKKIVVWSAGSKGITFLNVAGNNIQYIVDINPYKHNKYVAGTGAKVVSPEFLKQYNPEIVLLMNSIYDLEIREIINSLGLNPKILYG